MSFVRRHPVATFFLLAYVLTWCLVPWGTFFAPGALLAALVVVSVTEGRTGLRALGSRLVRWRVGWIWYVVAVAVPLGVHAVTIAANLALGASAPSSAPLTRWYGVAMAIGLNMIDPTGGPFSEEPSFRGFAQQRLQSGRSPLVATSIMATMITIWHLPLLVVPSFGLRPVEAAATVAVTFWYAWLFNQAGSSALITLIAHATEGSIQGSDLWAPGPDASREVWLYALAWCAAAAALLIAGRRFWLTASPSEPPVTSQVGSAVTSTA